MPTRKRRTTANSEQTYHHQNEQQHQTHQTDEQNEPFCLFEGDSDIIDTWFNDLDDADKVGCLQIDADELAGVVGSLGLMMDDDQHEASIITLDVIDSFLSNATVISALRLAFVNALYNDGMFDPSAVRAAARSQDILDVYSELLIQCTLTLLESHLIDVQRRKRAVVRMIAFATFFIFRVAVFTRWLRWPLGFISLLAMHIATTQTGASKDEAELASESSEEYLALHAQYKALIRRYQSHLQLLLVPFEPALPAVRYIAFNRTNSPINAKIDALACSICTATWVAEQFTMNLMTWICLVTLATLPFILTTIQQHGRRKAKAVLSQQVIHYTQVVVAALSQFIVVFYAFKTSYVDWIFALVFFLPSVTSFVISGVGLGLATCATVFIGTQRYVLDYAQHPVVYCVIWFCTCVCHMFMGYVQQSTLVWIVSWIVMLLLAPPQLVGGICVLSTLSTTALLSVGLTHLLSLVFEIGLLAVMSGLIMLFHFGKPFAVKVFTPLIKRMTIGVPGAALHTIMRWLHRVRTALVKMKHVRAQQTAAVQTDIS